MASDASTEPTEGEGQSPESALAEKVERQIAEQLERHLPSTPVAPTEFAHALAKVFAVEIREIMVSFSGPLPPPRMLQEYESVLPGLAERIVARAEKEQAFRHEMSRSQIAAAKDQYWHLATKTYLGQAGAFAIAMTAIGGGIWLLAAGKSAAGLGAIITALVALVAVFLGAKITDAIAASRKATATNGEEGGR